MATPELHVKGVETGSELGSHRVRCVAGWDSRSYHTLQRCTYRVNLLLK